MTQEETPIQPPKEETTTTPKTETAVSQADTDALLKEIDAVNQSLVSEDTRKLIEQERAAAKKEVLKELEAKKYLEEKNAEIAALKKQQEEREKETAAKLQGFQEQINSMAASRSVLETKNPFDNRAPPEVDAEKPFMKMGEEEMDSFEKESFYALLDRRR